MLASAVSFFDIFCELYLFHNVVHYLSIADSSCGPETNTVWMSYEWMKSCRYEFIAKLHLFITFTNGVGLKSAIAF